MAIEKINIGKIIKTHSFDGSLKMVVDALFLNKVIDFKHLFINNLPYFIEKIQKAGTDQFILKLEDVNSKEDAQILIGQMVYADKNSVGEWQQKLNYETIIGFQIFNQQNFVGKVLELVELPQQLLLTTIVEEKEIFIPLNEAFVVEINELEQKIVLNLPDNYIQTFLE